MIFPCKFPQMVVTLQPKTKRNTFSNVLLLTYIQRHGKRNGCTFGKGCTCSVTAHAYNACKRRPTIQGHNGKALRIIVTNAVAWELLGCGMVAMCVGVTHTYCGSFPLHTTKLLKQSFTIKFKKNYGNN